MDVVKREYEVVLDVIETIVAQTACIVDMEKDKKCMDNPKNKYGEEVVALLDGIVSQTALIVDPKKDPKCMDNPKIQPGENMGVVLDVIEKEKTMNVDNENEDEVLDAIDIINDENGLVAVNEDISKRSSKSDSFADSTDLVVGRTNNVLEDITQSKNGIGLEENAVAQLLLKNNSHENEIEIIELIDNEDDEKYLISPPVEPIVTSHNEFRFSASNIEQPDITKNRNGIILEEDTLAQIHPETNSQENEIEIIEVQNAKSRNSADEKRSQDGSKRLLKESLFIPYHEETNAGLHNFTGDIEENLAVNDKDETWFRYNINRSHRQAAASGKAEEEKKPSSKQIKKKPELTRHSLMKNLKDEMEQKKEASFDRHKKIEQADEEIYDEEDKEIYEGEADDEEEDLDSDWVDSDGCPKEKLFPNIKMAEVKTKYPSNFGNSISYAHPSHQNAVEPSSSYTVPSIQGSQCFASQDSEDIQMICSGQFSHEENQLSAWSPNSQRKMETDENNDDVVVIAEKRQSFEENSVNKRKRECSSPSPMNKKFKEEELSSCSSPGGWEETFPSYSPQTYENGTSPYSPTPTNHGDSSDSERIISGAKKCKVLSYSSEEDDEANKSVIADDKDKNISHQVAMVSPSDSVSANEDNKNSSYQKNSESSEDYSDSNDVVEVNKPLNIADDKDKNVIPKAIESLGDSVSANAKENSLNPMEPSLQVKDHDTVLQKPKKINDFLELEAELDSNEEASSDESESEFPEDQKDDLFDDVPVNEENPQELAIIHHKYICEDDAQVVKQLQEQYLPGGELHEEGKGRQKKFLWNNNDSTTSQNETLISDSEQEEVAETSISQEKAIWRQKATVVHGSDSESDDVISNEKSAKKLPVNIVGKANTSQVINKSSSKASPLSTAVTVRRSGSLIGVNGSNKLSLKASNTGQKKTVLFKAMHDAHQQDGI